MVCGGPKDESGDRLHQAHPGGLRPAGVSLPRPAAPRPVARLFRSFVCRRCHDRGEPPLAVPQPEQVGAEHLFHPGVEVHDQP